MGVFWDGGESGADLVTIATASRGDERSLVLIAEKMGCERLEWFSVEIYHTNLIY